MARLLPLGAWQTRALPTEQDRHRGFFVAHRNAATRTAVLCVDDVACMLDGTARRDLSRTVAEFQRRGYQPEVHVVGIARGDDLVIAATLTLYLQLRTPKLPITTYADPARIRSELYGLFVRAMPRPGLLLKALDRATFARMHYLIGRDDQAAVDSFAPALPFVDIISDGDAVLARRLAKALDINKRNLQLMVTRRCQLRCVYCPADKRDEDLALDDALRAIDLLLAGDSETFRVDFAGGEPLLRKAWVQKLIETCHERAEQRGKRDSYYLVTNGIELDDAFCGFLAEHDVELEISIDGDEVSHNNNAKTATPGINPYRALLAGFEHVKRHDLRYNAVLVFTPDSFSRLAANLEHILGLGFGNIAINYAIGYRWESALVESYVDLLATLVERYDMLANRHDAPLFIKNLLHKSEPTVLNSELMVDTDGSLHLLSEWQFKKALRHHRPSLSYCLDDLDSIDDVFFTKAQVYHLLYEVYRSSDGDTLGLVHNSVETGLLVARQLRERLRGALR